MSRGGFAEESMLPGATANPFWWVGRLGYYRQPDTGDYWVRERVVRPEVGRWVSRDPLCAHHTVRTWLINCYAYVANRTLNAFDPSGLMTACNNDTPVNLRCGENAIDKLKSMCTGGLCSNPSLQPWGGSWTCDPAKERQDIVARMREIDWILEHWDDPGGSVAFRYVCTSCCCVPPDCPGDPWGSISTTFYCSAWGKLKSGCVKQCLTEHESVHRRQCGTPVTEKQEESKAYGTEKKCLRKLLQS